MLESEKEKQEITHQVALKDITESHAKELQDLGKYHQLIDLTLLSLQHRIYTVVSTFFSSLSFSYQTIFRIIKDAN